MNYFSILLKIHINNPILNYNKLAKDATTCIIKATDSAKNSILELFPISDNKDILINKMRISDELYKIFPKIGTLFDEVIGYMEEANSQEENNNEVIKKHLDKQAQNIFNKHKKNIENHFQANPLISEVDIRDILSKFHDNISLTIDCVIQIINTHHLPPVKSTSANTDCEQPTEVQQTEVKSEIKSAESNSMDFTDMVDSEKSPTPITPL